jgi:hypothetical protein
LVRAVEDFNTRAILLVAADSRVDLALFWHDRFKSVPKTGQEWMAVPIPPVSAPAGNLAAELAVISFVAVPVVGVAVAIQCVEEVIEIAEKFVVVHICISLLVSQFLVAVLAQVNFLVHAVDFRVQMDRGLPLMTVLTQHCKYRLSV